MKGVIQGLKKENSVSFLLGSLILDTCTRFGKCFPLGNNNKKEQSLSILQRCTN